jgi:hypothetical protein
MKRKTQLSVVILTLVVILFMGSVAGKGILTLLSGATQISDDMTFDQARDTYLSYEVTYPVVSYPEEYYSGDLTRVKRMAYIVYDEGRQTFLKVVIAKENTSSFDRLLRAANMSDELKESWGEDLESQLEPVAVTGSLTSIEDSEAMAALSDAFMSSDFEGTGEMSMAVLAQDDWYVLEEGYIQGLPAWHFWICTAVLGINLLFLLIALISLFRKGAKADVLSWDSESSVTKFLKRQLPWLEAWCRKGRGRRTRQAFLVMIIVAGALTALGFYVGGSPFEVVTCHLALGLGIGELYGIPLLLGMGLAFDPYKLLKNYDKSWEKLYPVQSEREAIAQELLEADDSWVVQELGKEDCVCATLGDRYWMILWRTAGVTLIDSSRVGKMYSETVSGQVRTGKVRYNYTSYVIYIYYQGDEEKKHANVQFGWNTENASGHFLALARKRLGDRAQTVIRQN